MLTIRQIVKTLPETAPAPRAPRTGRITFHDSTISVWEDGCESGMREAVLKPLIAMLRRDGWRVVTDPVLGTDMKTLHPTHKYARKGDLEARIECAGRALQVTFFQNVANVENPNGGRYDFDKLAGMPYLLRLQALAAIRRIAGFLSRRHGYRVEPPRAILADVRAGVLSPSAFIDMDARESGHYDPKLGRARWNHEGNRTSADGRAIEPGATVWLTDDRGRWQRGRAYYNLNCMWWVVLSERRIENKSCRDLRLAPPADARARMDTRFLRQRRERAMRAAAETMDFVRAEAIRRHAFGETPLYRIFKPGSGWYRSNAAGYTPNEVEAGLYRREEAEAHARGCHERIRIVPAQKKETAQAA